MHVSVSTIISDTLHAPLFGRQLRVPSQAFTIVTGSSILPPPTIPTGRASRPRQLLCFHCNQLSNMHLTSFGLVAMEMVHLSSYRIECIEAAARTELAAVTMCRSQLAFDITLDQDFTRPARTDLFTSMTTFELVDVSLSWSKFTLQVPMLVSFPQARFRRACLTWFVLQWRHRVPPLKYGTAPIIVRPDRASTPRPTSARSSFSLSRF